MKNFTEHNLSLTPNHSQAQYTQVLKGTANPYFQVNDMTTLQQAIMHKRHGYKAASPVCLWVGRVV